MPGTDIACCTQCGGHNVMFVGYANATDRGYHYFCCDCGHATPDRPEAKDADADVDWCPAADVRFAR